MKRILKTIILFFIVGLIAGYIVFGKSGFTGRYVNPVKLFDFKSPEKLMATFKSDHSILPLEQVDIREKILISAAVCSLIGLFWGILIKKKKKDIIFSAKTIHDTKSIIDFCGVCGKNCSGLPVMEHKPNGTICCEECGRKIGGVIDFIRLAVNASRCSNCGFLYISSLANFSKCPCCMHTLQ